ncbi:MAG: hypothetical protein EP338_00525 [Bacteroidetes bacterium]|nr:MAG: hypothetical protein EP338_00525 [Bacteroidota bacterium]
MNFKNIFLLLFLSLFLFTCSKNPLDVDPPRKDLGIGFIQLDSILVHTETTQLKPVLEKLPLEKGQILDYLLGHCLVVGQLNEAETVKRIHAFLHDPYVSRLEKRISEKFPKLDAHQKKIEQGFLYLNYHFPKRIIPKRVVFMNSFFASNVFCTENEIGVGLERYLGPDCDVIQEIPNQQMFQWIKDEMKVEFLERDVLTGWIMTHYVEEANENLADAMIRWGKILYLCEASFPKEAKEKILRYSAKDYKWAQDNETAFWKFLVEEKLLFKKDEKQQSNFLNDAPFTIGLPEKGPARLGQFLGWRMIHRFMEEHDDLSLEQLLSTKYTQILQAYRIE